MAEPVLKVAGLIKRFGGLIATDNLSLDILPGEVHAVIGPNGAGKTTMISQLIGELRPDAGSIRFMGQDITTMPVHRRSHLGIARSFQITSIFLNFTALENVMLSVQAHDGHSFRFWRDARSDPRLREPALAALAQVGLQERADVVASALSHGEHRQLEIAMALATKPKLLLLDEPTAGLSRSDTQRVMHLIESLKGRYTIVLIEHKMDVVMRISDRITVMYFGEVLAEGTPQEIRANPKVREAYLGRRA